ncbi:hypothetical protein NIES4103_63400 [Nostoc sp. NIES-4103]|nr:hypothetical protein NIES4103_63400 [Nostoc sp. NIES-4103]
MTQLLIVYLHPVDEEIFPTLRGCLFSQKSHTERSNSVVKYFINLR